MNKPNLRAVFLSGMIVAPFAFAQSVAPDNAKSNQIDASNSRATADAQTNNASDVDLTRRIRQSLIADKALSTYAHNVKVVTANGHVTLNGVVRSEDEKGAVESKAVDIAGMDKVTNEIKVAPKK